MRSSSLLLIPALCGVSLAHFQLRYPDSIGFKDDDESKSPCGGFTPNFDKDDLFDFHVEGDSIAIRSTHQQSNWLFRVTLEEDAKSGWEQIAPIVQQSGLGDYCNPAITLNSSYIGKKGVIGVVSSAPDGLLYQCISANFVKGKADQPSACKNSSSVKIYRTDDAKLSDLVEGGSSSNNSDASGTETGSAPSSTESDGAAASLQAWSPAGLSNAMTLLAMAFVGGALII